jgi:hypothetical protein
MSSAAVVNSLQQKATAEPRSSRKTCVLCASQMKQSSSRQQRVGAALAAARACPWYKGWLEGLKEAAAAKGHKAAVKRVQGSTASCAGRSQRSCLPRRPVWSSCLTGERASSSLKILAPPSARWLLPPRWQPEAPHPPLASVPLFCGGAMPARALSRSCAQSWLWLRRRWRLRSRGYHQRRDCYPVRQVQHAAGGAAGCHQRRPLL